MKTRLLLLCLMLPLPALADPALITAVGQATVSAVPDTVTITAGVTNSGRTAREALGTNSQTMTAVFAAMKAMNIPDRDIRTTNLNLQPQYAPMPAGNAGNLADRPVTGYRATNNVSVTIADVTRAGAVLDALVTAGANQSGGISYAIRNSSKLLDQARAEAVKDAMARAKIYADTAGVRLGALHAITDSQATPQTILGRDAGLAGFAPPAPPPPPIGVGEQSLRVTVTVSWDVK